MSAWKVAVRALDLVLPARFLSAEACDEPRDGHDVHIAPPANRVDVMTVRRIPGPTKSHANLASSSAAMADDNAEEFSPQPAAGRDPKRTGRRPRGLLAILLDAGGAQSGKAVAVDRILPGEEFLDRQRVATAGLFEREQSAANGCDHLGLAANHPALRSRCREIGNGERAAVGPDDVLDPRAVGFGHVTLTHWTQKARD